MSKEVLLAFSGGIDSCAALKILRQEGYKVTALTIDMMGDEELIRTAKQRAAELELPLHVVDAQSLFQERIINNFTSEYLAGRTPAPCTLCNREIKWEIVAQMADKLGIEKIATGHYFQMEEREGRRYIVRAKDRRKDQSYYLWSVPQSLLARALTPMGQMIKEEVKAQSKIKNESMGVCFLKGQHYAEYITQQCGEMAEGDIVDRKGIVVGRHNGIARYTIGQRRGEGIPEGMRVVELRGAENQICVGDNSKLFHRTLHLNGCHFVDYKEVESSQNITVMIRGLGLNPEGFAKVKLSDQKDCATIHLAEPAWAAAPGQPIVLYSDERVIGGGYLTQSE